jgi:hypothetical protein
MTLEPSRDFITVGLDEVRARDSSRTLIARTHWVVWIVLATLLAVLLLQLRMAFSDPPPAVNTAKIEAALQKLQNEITILKSGKNDQFPDRIAGHWTSGDFGSGNFTCIADGDHPPCKFTKQLDDLLNDDHNGPLVVLVTGSHDPDPLSSTLRSRVGSNIQLAQLRADAVRKNLEGRITNDARKTAVWIFSSFRGESNTNSTKALDRTVTVRVLRVGP